MADAYNSFADYACQSPKWGAFARNPGSYASNRAAAQAHIARMKAGADEWYKVSQAADAAGYRYHGKPYYDDEAVPVVATVPDLLSNFSLYIAECQEAFAGGGKREPKVNIIETSNELHRKEKDLKRLVEDKDSSIQKDRDWCKRLGVSDENIEASVKRLEKDLTLRLKSYKVRSKLWRWSSRYTMRPTSSMRRGTDWVK